VRLGIDVSQHQLTWDELQARVHFAEEAGFDGAWVFDHFKPLYGDPRGPCLEGWTLLAALAASTQRIRLGTLVTGITYRHPSVLAAEAVTVDNVSGGRLELGVGAAWFQGEHNELGIPFPGRGERAMRLEETIQVMRLLMTCGESLELWIGARRRRAGTPPRFCAPEACRSRSHGTRCERRRTISVRSASSISW
jgi:alkanesulfonate monooxygenase SsuD/methylene tetrahydromethanopterin reductase-like flavin-dependent oxidoreductase (luciferase family)